MTLKDLREGYTLEGSAVKKTCLIKYKYKTLDAVYEMSLDLN